MQNAECFRLSGLHDVSLQTSTPWHEAAADGRCGGPVREVVGQGQD